MSILQIPSGYRGRPYTGALQQVPGRVQAVHYDLGGEGVAFHDFDTVNPGSGGLNKGDSPLDRFRIAEPVGISYTKKDIDFDEAGKAMPLGKLYLGWTAPGEWVNYSVKVARAGSYRIDALMSSAHENAEISLSFNGADKTGPIAIATTTHWHKWRLYEKLAVVKLEQGEQTMTLHFIKEGNMNVDYMEFVAL